jgi:CelD/BcsL family acetyltransferase involved in cellulose biosynthesis
MSRQIEKNKQKNHKKENRAECGVVKFGKFREFDSVLEVL